MNVGDFLKKNINLLKGFYEGSDLNTDKVMSRIEKNKNAFINKPYSDRIRLKIIIRNYTDNFSPVAINDVKIRLWKDTENDEQD